MKRRPTVRTVRTGRFKLLLEGPRVTVVDTLHPEVQIRAKVTEWLELLQTIQTSSAGTTSSSS